MDYCVLQNLKFLRFNIWDLEMRNAETGSGNRLNVKRSSGKGENCNHRLKEFAGTLHQWCSWGPYKFQLFQHHTRSSTEMIIQVGDPAAKRKSAKYAITHNTHLKKSKCYCYGTFKRRWPMRNDVCHSPPSHDDLKREQLLARFFLLYLVGECTHVLSKFRFKIIVKKFLHARIRPGM